MPCSTENCNEVPSDRVLFLAFPQSSTQKSTTCVEPLPQAKLRKAGSGRVRAPCRPNCLRVEKGHNSFYAHDMKLAVHPIMICFRHYIYRVKKSLTKGNIAGSAEVPKVASLNCRWRRALRLPRNGVTRVEITPAPNCRRSEKQRE